VFALFLVLGGCASSPDADPTCWNAGEMQRLLGEYEVVDAVRYRGGLISEAEVRKSIGERVLLGKRAFEQRGKRLQAPAYAAVCEAPLAEGNVPEASRRRSDFHGLRSGQGTIRLIEVRDAKRPGEAPHRVFEAVDDELWEMHDGWLLKLRKRVSKAGGIDNRRSSNSSSEERK
jgi:hypothetical protein